MKRPFLQSSSLTRRSRRRGRRGRGRRRSRTRGRLATADRVSRGLQVNVVHQPATAPGAHHVDRQHLIAVGALQLDTIGPQVFPSGYHHRPFNDAVSAVVEILLDHGEPLAQHVGAHRARRGPAFGAPELAHAFLIVGLHRREKLRDRLVHRLRHRRAGARTFAARGTGEQEQREGEPSLHEWTPGVRTNRR